MRPQTPLSKAIPNHPPPTSPALLFRYTAVKACAGTAPHTADKGNQMSTRKPNQRRVDRASEGSFPASDPPPWTSGPRKTRTRIERDTMGEIRVPADALYGAQTQRAVQNFPATGHHLQEPFLRALGLVKACAARANGELGALPSRKAVRIAQAADLIANGIHLDHFVVDVFQTGSGTSTNMNANEVIGKLAKAHPNDEVNRSQSSNDVIPSAMHIAAALRIRRELLPAMDALHKDLERKSQEFWEIVKVGRTHLQDATPIRLGQEFSGYAAQVRSAAEALESALSEFYELPLGGTAVGTGLNAPPGFGDRAIEWIAQGTGEPFRPARNRFASMASKDAVVRASGALRAYAVALGKIANDIRWMGSGPRAGLAELRLPELQPGSSIMPGKVNPVLCESVLMICAQVHGHDAAIAWCGAGGNFELNTMMPLMAYNLLDSIALLSVGSEYFARKCVAGLEADTTRLAQQAERSLAAATALAPAIGYEKAAAIAKLAHASGRTVREVARQQSGLDSSTLDRLLAQLLEC
jgi:fumarate hydratase, class II